MTEEQEKMSVYKFTLSSKKVIYLREPKINDTEVAMQVSGKMAGNENQAYLSVLFQKELVKLLLVRINEKTVSMSDKEQLDKLFTFKEYGQVSSAIKQIAGDGEESGNLMPEITTL